MTFFLEKKVKKEFPKFFKLNAEEISDKKNIADEFNKFFTNIGPNLSKNIKTPPNITYQSFLKKKYNVNFSI